MSEATRFSPSPMPTTTGVAFLAATRRPGSDGRHRDDRERAAQARDRRARRVGEALAAAALGLDQVRDHLGVGVGLQRAPAAASSARSSR